MIKEKLDLRERLEQFGPEHLKDAELIALILRTGTSTTPLLSIAHSVSTEIETAKPATVYQSLCAVEGMGPSKVSALMAAMELGRRYCGYQYQKIKTAKEIYPLIQHYADRKQEQFIVISLNGAYEIIAIRVVSIGILNRTIVHPREVFSDPIADRAAAIIVAHNHPSGSLEPSDEDMAITRRLAQSGEILGIPVLDHIIISPRGGYFSFAETGLSMY